MIFQETGYPRMACFLIFLMFFRGCLFSSGKCGTIYKNKQEVGTTDPKKQLNSGWIFAVVFVVMGILIRFCLVGYSFSAWICFGIAGIILCYQLLNLWLKKNPKLPLLLRRILTVLVIFFSLAYGITAGVIWFASNGMPHQACDYVVVLGAGVNGTVPSLSLRNRLDAAYSYLTEFPESICVVSGCQGDGEDISEAQCMYNELVRMGIDSDRVWMEDQATNTRENLRYSLEIIRGRTGSQPEEIGIISSEYHLLRAGFFARELGIDSFGIPAETTWLSLRINYTLREVAAVWYYIILGG